MRQIDRYITGQLVRLFGFFGLVLVGIYWINQAVILFDQLISDGQSAGIFLEMSILGLPVIALITLPFAAFIASVSTISRLNADSELIVLRAAGASPWRLIRPVAVFGVGATVLLLVLSHIIAPASQRVLKLREAQIAQDQMARLLTPGSFSDGDPGLTVYFGSRDANGQLHDILISDRREHDFEQLVTAQSAAIVQTPTAQSMILIDGIVQRRNVAHNLITTLRFDELSYGLSDLVPDLNAPVLGYKTVSTAALWTASEPLRGANAMSAAQLRFKAHERSAQPALVLIAALLGASPLLVAGHSRFGLRRYIFVAVGLVVIVMVLDGNVRSAGRVATVAPLIAYGAVCVGALLALAPLAWFSLRNRKARG